MSTFRGFVEEFPDIRIDYFRKIQGKDNPLACFLSHVHSDHIQGLESFHSPFIYCSPATRELLLRLEKYPHRMNFHRGILELKKQHYKHLSKLLKTVALNTPTEIELKLGKSIRVTLLDANHCAGAVMFLIENESKAILYTGDIRSEPWWVNSLTRNPVILPYTHGLKRLDKIYLDTTFASKKAYCRRFPTKADGLKELLEKVSKYPTDTVFHLHAWTFGYEDVWIALSSALRSQIHVDEYKYSLYQSLGITAKTKNLCHEGSALHGFECGNKFQNGCLTPKQDVRLHSCQLDMGCSALEGSQVVYIRPIISRSAGGVVLPEVGTGGGGEDLNQLHELALNDAATVEKLIGLCTEAIADQETLSKAFHLINKARKAQKIGISLDTLKLDKNHKTIPLAEIAKLLVKLVVGDTAVSQIEEISKASSTCEYTGKARALGTCAMKQKLSRSLEFPYSRHSSYEELCDLVKVFKPVDVYPCTIDEDYMNLSMELLASQREVLKRGTNDSDSQATPSSGEGSVDQRGTSPVSLLGSAADPEPHALDGLDRVPKRLRTTPSSARNYEGDLTIGSLPTEILPSRHNLPRLKQSFESYLGQSKRERIIADLKNPEPASNYIGSHTNRSQTAIFGGHRAFTATHLESNPRANTVHNERPANRPVDLHPGTQAAPIELSSSNPSSQGDESGDFALENMPELDHIPHVLNESRLDSDTQVTISDTAFETQSPHSSDPDTRAAKLQQRREAYKAAKKSNAIWGIAHGLISSNGHHGAEEVEL